MKTALKLSYPAAYRTAIAFLLLGLASVTYFYVDDSAFVNVRYALFDTYQQEYPRSRHDNQVAVVLIDDASLKKEGQWPWPRNRLAQLIERVSAGQPKVIGLDIAFPESDTFSLHNLRRRGIELPPGVIEQWPNHDQALAAVFAHTPLVLGTFAGNNLNVEEKPLERGAVGLRGYGGEADVNSFLPKYKHRFPHFSVLENAAPAYGLLNSKLEQGVIRRGILLANVSGQNIPALSVAMLNLSLAKPMSVLGFDLLPFQKGLSGFRLPNNMNVSIPTDKQGLVYLHFGKFLDNCQEHCISATDLLSGKVSPNILKDRYVLIGVSGVGIADLALTPLGEVVPGVDIHAQLLENLLGQKVLSRPFWIELTEQVLFLLTGLLLIWLVPRLSPRRVTLLGLGLIILFVGIGFPLFRFGYYLFDGLTPILLLIPLFIVLLRNSLWQSEQQRRISELALQNERDAATRLAGELNAARRIQLGLVPNPDILFANEKRFELAALLEPAKEVGGDYYDCFMLDQRRLCLTIGDVTGKGIPASLFMAISKTLSGTLTRQRDGDPGLSLQAIESELNLYNSQYLFVTALLLVIDVETGLMRYACAGHEAPLLRRGNEVRRLPTEEISGTPLCAMGDYPFTSAEFQLQPGDWLCLFTDGVNEATDGTLFYGTERVIELLRALPSDTTAHTCLKAIHQATTNFMAGSAPADDLTLLTFRWLGCSRTL